MLSKTYQLESFGITDIGLAREHNEDVWASYPAEGLFILADGMGGHAAGEIASREAVERLYTLFHERYAFLFSTLQQAKLFFEEAFVQVNRWIYTKGEEHEEYRGMGTTLCALFLHDQGAIVTHVGDSRIYRFRRGMLEQLTQDHSLVSELVALGAMGSAESEKFPYKHILTRAVGTHSRVEPTLQEIEVESEDLFLLCSDGMSNAVRSEEVEGVLQTPAPLSNKGESLIALALEHGSTDNITLILVQVHHL